MRARAPKLTGGTSPSTASNTVGGPHGAEIASPPTHELAAQYGGGAKLTGPEGKAIRKTGTESGGAMAIGHPQTPRGSHSLCSNHDGPTGMTKTTQVGKPGGGGKKT